MDHDHKFEFCVDGSVFNEWDDIVLCHSKNVESPTHIFFKININSIHTQ